MKSIVLCENILVEKSENAKNMEETIEDEKVEKTVINSDEISKTVIEDIREESASILNGENKRLETSEEEEEEATEKLVETNETESHCNGPEEMEKGENLISENQDSGNVVSDNVNSLTTPGNSDVLKADETESTVLAENKLEDVNISEDTELMECSEKSSSPLKTAEDTNSEEDVIVCGTEKSEIANESVKSEPMDTASATVEPSPHETKKEPENSSEVVLKTNNDLSAKEPASPSNSEIEILSVKEEEEGEGGGGKEGVQEQIEDILLDVDENKENEKHEKICRENDSLNDPSSKCDIQVGECKTIPDSGDNPMWIDKPEEDSKENNLSSSQEMTVEGTESGIDLNEEFEKCNDHEEIQNGIESPKEDEEDMALEIDLENSNCEENHANDEEQVNCDESASTKPVENGESKEIKSYESVESNLRKRQMIDAADDGSSVVKKKRMSESIESNEVKFKSENSVNSSRCESNANEDTAFGSAEEPLKKVTDANILTNSDQNTSKLKTSIDDETERLKTQSGEKAALTSTFLSSLRGTLKSLTRSDLEELIVQKLCEVVTERSIVGELRRKAQALEQDQERWKGKVQSLTKLVREMEMVMKKYMSEVQKHTKDGDSRSVAPLKVSRSVGLQVSFYSSSKGPKPSPAQSAAAAAAATASASPVQNANGRNAKPTPGKSPPQTNYYSKNNWKKAANQKSSPTPQKSPVNVNVQKKPVSLRGDFNVLQQNRPIVPQTVLNGNRLPPNQVMRPNKSASATQTTIHPLQQPQAQLPHPQQAQPQQQSNGSKIIDLTDDDDRQPGNIGKSSDSIKVVNHLPQSQITQNNRFAYILPASNATTTASGSQNRQVLIATPAVGQQNRQQLMCSMPPLLFKGGNVQQTAAPAAILNRPNRVILPKPLRHPAPLPAPPVIQVNSPNLKKLPPRPALKISKVQTGIVLSWNMSLGPEYAPISSYQLYAYQESNSPPATSLWKKVGDVKALPLPMACTLTQFMSGHKYHFAVRAVDLHSRIGPFSFPGTIVLVK